MMMISCCGRWYHYFPLSISIFTSKPIDLIGDTVESKIGRGDITVLTKEGGTVLCLNGFTGIVTFNHETAFLMVGKNQQHNVTLGGPLTGIGQ